MKTTELYSPFSLVDIATLRMNLLLRGLSSGIALFRGVINNVLLFLTLLYQALQPPSVSAQNVLTLEKAIDLTQRQSVYYHKAKNTYERSYWKFENFKAVFKPQIRLNATVPTLYREIYPITQPDGSILFQKVAQANNGVGINLQQNIALTGGLLSIGTKLQRTDNFSGNGSSYFLSTPFNISYQQGSLLYNELKWVRKIEPLLYETAVKAYTEEMEKASLQATTLYFDGLMAQVALEVAQTNLANSDTLFNLSQKRFLLGTIAKSDILELELKVLKARNDLSNAVINAEVRKTNLKRILGFSVNDSILLSVPDLPPTIQINYQQALQEASWNRQSVLEFQTKRMLANQEIAKAKGQNSLTLSLIANIGTQQTAQSFLDSYRNLQNQQYIGLTLDMPLQDWGYRKSQIRLAKADRELLEVNLLQDGLKFEQEIYLQVLQFNQQPQQVHLARKAAEISRERFLIAKERYLLGKISVTDLNIAMQEGANAKENFIESLRTYWLSYSNLRMLTLFDFFKNEKIYYKTN